MINYQFLNDSIQFYEQLGFKRIESPWLVSESINDITCPPDAKKYYVQKGDKRKTFVASGEQSFLYLINKGFVPDGHFQTITPCMRDDDFDDWHTKYFIKNELIIHGDRASESGVQSVCFTALDFFKSLIPEKHHGLLKVVEKEFSSDLDIEFNGVEIGSYGFRKSKFCKWIYGTGIAEPRFSKLLKYVEGF